jgi:hypothetical protein
VAWFLVWSCAQPPSQVPPAPAPTAPPSTAPVAAPPTHRTSDVPCDGVEDCWFSDEDPAQPIARPPQLKDREFQPCSDGDFGLQCLEGHCALRLGLAC